MHVQSVTVQGPYNGTASAASPSPNVFSCRPATPAEELPCARRIASALATRAYRRPLSSGELDGLLTFFKQERTRGDFATGIGFVLRRILASPVLRVPAGARARRHTPGHAVPRRGRRAGVEALVLSLEQHPRRRADGSVAARAGSRSRRCCRSRCGACWRIRVPMPSSAISRASGCSCAISAASCPNSESFPDFDDNLRQAFRREAELFFESILKEDRSVLDLLSADYTFVNERLARHYGIPNVVGSHFRRVPLPDETRRGLLGKGAVLLVTSHATTTSPVLRGKWVLENLMGAPPPPPPPDVPALEEAAAGAAPRTMREQMELHRVEAALCGLSQADGSRSVSRSRTSTWWAPGGRPTSSASRSIRWT